MNYFSQAFTLIAGLVVTASTYVAPYVPDTFTDTWALQLDAEAIYTQLSSDSDNDGIADLYDPEPINTYSHPRYQPVGIDFTLEEVKRSSAITKIALVQPKLVEKPAKKNKKAISSKKTDLATSKQESIARMAESTKVEKKKEEVAEKAKQKTPIPTASPTTHAAANQKKARAATPSAAKKSPSVSTTVQPKISKSNSSTPVASYGYPGYCTNVLSSDVCNNTCSLYDPLECNCQPQNNGPCFSNSCNGWETGMCCNGPASYCTPGCPQYDEDMC